MKTSSLTTAKTYIQAQTWWLKFYEKAVIESEAGIAVVKLKSKAQPKMIGLPHNIQVITSSFITVN